MKVEIGYRPRIAGRDAGLEEISKLRAYSLNDPDPVVKARQASIRERVGKQFKPLIDSAREAEEPDFRLLQKLVF